MRLLIVVFIISFIGLANTKPVFAGENAVTQSAQTVLYLNNPEPDPRVRRLQAFFENYKSPLSNHASDFIYWADEYEIDYRLVASISGVESTFGKRIPQNSFNAYGWANGDYKFKSWEDSIEHVSKTLRLKYYNKGATNINKIARRYAPPSTTWAKNVKFFMNKIDSTPLEFDL